VTVDELTRLSTGKYLSLTTFRKSGVAVATPVWLVRDGEHLYVTTQADSGKAKRLRNNSEVLLAPCDARGNLTGAQVPGTAVILNEADSARVAKLIKARYGILGRLMMLTSAFRRNSASVGLEITPQ
jgi:PPOX class probable F420-dependent enzyme